MPTLAVSSRGRQHGSMGFNRQGVGGAFDLHAEELGRRAQDLDIESLGEVDLEALRKGFAGGGLVVPEEHVIHIDSDAQSLAVDCLVVDVWLGHLDVWLGHRLGAVHLVAWSCEAIQLLVEEEADCLHPSSGHSMRQPLTSGSATSM